MERIKLLIVSSAVLGAGMFCLPSPAAPALFTIDNSKSLILVSGLFSHFAITPQGTGALGTSYSGSINANVSGSTIQFSGGSDMIAKTNGIWQPAVGGTAGSAPADYGPQASVNYPPFGIYTFYGAMRNISFDVTSPVLPLTGTNFNGTNLVFSFAPPAGALDYYSSIKEGSVALGGYATNTIAVGSTLTTNGNTQTLFIPINAQFVFTLISTNDSTLDLMGQIVATNLITVAPPVMTSPPA